MSDLKHYMSLPYRMEIIPDDGAFIVRIPDLPGCMSSGETIEEALEGIKDAKELWISARLEADNSVPEPPSEDDKSYSGKFVLRIPKSLHRALDEKARAEHMSLNSYLLYLVTERHTEKSISSHSKMFTAVCGNVLGPPVHGLTIWSETTKRTEGQGFKDIGDSLENLPFVPRPPRGSHLVFGKMNKELKKKEFPH